MHSSGYVTVCALYACFLAGSILTQPIPLELPTTLLDLRLCPMMQTGIFLFRRPRSVSNWLTDERETLMLPCNAHQLPAPSIPTSSSRSTCHRNVATYAACASIGDNDICFQDLIATYGDNLETWN
ncbi:hypothetical protein GGS26DRAFT_313400 [Hypomontagnella submonticulosa]|nr:hypothetical protein GGS26DRAFT_313400 [Hypomontagnella submonticulosa]